MRTSKSFRTIGVEKNHTGIPRFNPGRFKVAIKGTQTFIIRGIV